MEVELKLSYRLKLGKQGLDIVCRLPSQNHTLLGLLPPYPYFGHESTPRALTLPVLVREPFGVHFSEPVRSPVRWPGTSRDLRMQGIAESFHLFSSQSVYRVPTPPFNRTPANFRPFGI